MYASTGCMMVVAEFLSYYELMNLQVCGKKLYNDIVPNVMNNRKLYPQIGIREFLFDKVPYEPKIIMENLVRRSDA